MTLLEVLVALLLFSSLSVGILTALQTGKRAYAMVLRSGRGVSEIAITQRFLREIIESAYPIDPRSGGNAGRFGFEGAPETLILSAPMRAASGAEGFYRYKLTLVPRADGMSDFVVLCALDHDDKRLESASAVQSGARQEVLLERVRGLRWDYLTHSENSAGPTLSRWVGSWHEPALPTLVRLRVELDPKDGRKWPELLVAPRLTEGAQCVFDLISGTCREGS